MLKHSGKTSLLAGAVATLLASPVWADRGETYTYNSLGLIETINGPRTDVSDITTLEYDDVGNLTKITNALGQTQLLEEYDAGGRVGLITDENGVKTRLTYHSRGWLDSMTVVDPSNDRSKDLTTRYEYDNVGQVISTTSASGVVIHYDYDDARRLRVIRNEQGERIEFTPDDAGNITSEAIKDASANIRYQLTRTFDELSRVMDIVGSYEQKQHLDYDVNDNVEYDTDGRTNKDHNYYDALNRLVKVIDRSGVQTDIKYDTNDNIVSVRDPRGLFTKYGYNAYGDLETLESPDTGVATFTYDDAGNRVTAKDARGVDATMTYDALNRLSTVSFAEHAEENITYSYDQTNNNYGVGRLTRVQDQSGDTRLRYNALGQIDKTTVYAAQGGDPAATYYSYDASGQTDRITYPSGLVVRYSFNGLSQVDTVTVQPAGASSAQTVLHNIRYLPFGPVTHMEFGNGMVRGDAYDLDYRLQYSSLSGTQTLWDLAYEYDGNNNIESISNATDAFIDQLFAYDKMDRLQDADGQYGHFDYSYDKVGNRKTRDHLIDSSNSIKETYTYATTSNRLDNVTEKVNNGTGVLRQLNYDENGNLIGDTTGSEATATITYNQMNRPERWEKDGMVVTYQHNSFGQRIVKSSSAGTETYAYDLNGQLLVVNGANFRQEYVYLNGQMVAVVVSQLNGSETVSSQVYYVHNDHLATPQIITDQNQNVVWKVQSQTPFGIAEVNQDPDGDGNVVVFNVRFPGQYYDKETGTNYNYFRTYDPSLGRYVQSDPIGLNGGINTYGYVGGNPLRDVDPLGLSPRDVDFILDANRTFWDWNTNRGYRLTIIPDSFPFQNFLNRNINNIASVYGIFFPVCYQQAAHLQGMLYYQLNNNQLDDAWRFEVVGHRGIDLDPNGYTMQPHWWLMARSNNPNDPDILLDPWKNYVASQPKNCGCNTN